MLLTGLTRAELAEWIASWVTCEFTVDTLELANQAAFEGSLVAEITLDEGRVPSEMLAWWDLRDELLAAYAEAVQP